MIDVGSAWNGDSISKYVSSKSPEKAEVKMLKRKIMNSSMMLPKLVSIVVDLVESLIWRELRKISDISLVGEVK